MKYDNHKKALILLFLLTAIVFENSVFGADVVAQKISKNTHEVSVGAQLLKTILGLGLVVGIIIGIGWVARRYGTMKIGHDNLLTVRSGVSVGPKERIVLVEVGNEQILVGVAPGNVTKLHVLQEKIDVKHDQDVQDGGQFLAKLKKAIGDKGRQ